MTNIINNLRVIPRAQDYLDRKLGSRGEIFFDQSFMSVQKLFE